MLRGTITLSIKRHKNKSSNRFMWPVDSAPFIIWNSKSGVRLLNEFSVIQCESHLMSIEKKKQKTFLIFKIKNRSGCKSFLCKSGVSLKSPWLPNKTNDLDIVIVNRLAGFLTQCLYRSTPVTIKSLISTICNNMTDGICHVIAKIFVYFFMWILHKN